MGKGLSSTSCCVFHNREEPGDHLQEVQAHIVSDIFSVPIPTQEAVLAYQLLQQRER